MNEFAIYVLSSAAVSSAIAALILFLTKSWIAARLKSSIQHEYDQKLEAYKAQLKAAQEISLVELRSTIEKEAALQQAAHASFQQVQKAAIEKKLTSIDELWSAVVHARENTPAILVFLDVMVVSEYSNILKNPEMKELAAQLGNKRMIEIGNSLGKGVERTRPYIGEYLWALFYAYRAITMRALVLMRMGMSDPKKLNWHEDIGIKQLITSVFTSDQINQFESQEFGKFGYLRNNLEVMMLKAMSKIISGEIFSNDVLQQAEIISMKAQKLVQSAG